MKICSAFGSSQAMAARQLLCRINAFISDCSPLGIITKCVLQGTQKMLSANLGPWSPGCGVTDIKLILEAVLVGMFREAMKRFSQCAGCKVHRNQRSTGFVAGGRVSILGTSQGLTG